MIFLTRIERMVARKGLICVWVPRTSKEPFCITTHTSLVPSCPYCLAENIWWYDLKKNLAHSPKKQIKVHLENRVKYFLKE